MLYEIENTNDYIELVMNAKKKISVNTMNTNFYPTISLCFKAPATLHNLRQFMEYRASECWTLIG